MSTKNIGLAIIVFFSCFVFSCDNEYFPKPKAYPRFYLPQKKYVKYQAQCPYEFEYPEYGQIEDKNYFFNERLKSDSCWINIFFPSLNSKVHISYKNVNNRDSLAKLMEDAYKLTTKHTLKADYIKDSIIENGDVKGIWYELGGNAASHVQFFLTDDKSHYLRGALYFENRPNIDSMKPYIDFVRADVRHLVNTFHWK